MVNTLLAKLSQFHVGWSWAVYSRTYLPARKSGTIRYYVLTGRLGLQIVTKSFAVWLSHLNMTFEHGLKTNFEPKIEIRT